jgi:hypothetical protein
MFLVADTVFPVACNAYDRMRVALLPFANQDRVGGFAAPGVLAFIVAGDAR